MKTGKWVVMALGLVLMVGGLVGCESEQQKSEPAAVRPDEGAGAAEAVEVEVIEEAEVTEESGAAEAATAAPATVDTGEKPGELVAEPMTLELGVVEPGSSTEGIYVLKNVGEGTVHISGTGASCQCTVAKLDNMTLAPGESTTLRMTYKASTHPGKVTKRVWVNVKPPSTPRKLTMTFKAMVRQHIAAQPEAWQFEMRDVPDNSKPLVLKSEDGAAFRVTSVTVSGKVAEVAFDPKAEQAEHTLPITVDQEKLRQTQRGSVSVMTTHPKGKRVSVPFTTLLPFRAEPRRKVFRNLTSGQQQKAVITVVSNYDEAFELGEISSDKGLVEVLSKTAVEGGYKLTTVFKVPKKPKSRQLKDSLRVPIKGRAAETLEVVFYGRTKGPAAKRPAPKKPAPK